MKEKLINLIEAKEMKPKNIIGMNINKFDEEAKEYLYNEFEFVSCEKCKELDNTNILVWITSEDFEPKEGEVVPKELYKKYDCLCEECYLEEIEVK